MYSRIYCTTPNPNPSQTFKCIGPNTTQNTHPPTHAMHRTHFFPPPINPSYSVAGILKYHSIAALKPANPTHPNPAACGPALAASSPPVTHPAAIPFFASFLALNPSIQHSVPANMAPTMLKLRAELSERVPMSRRPWRICCRMGRSAMAREAGVRAESYDICKRRGLG